VTVLPIHPHLARDAVDLLAGQTFCGQAHFAGSGPPLRHCAQCSYWLGKPGGKAAVCAKFLQLMSLSKGPKVPASAPACKYFAQREETS
jgi:hypothetical protein